MRMSFFQIDLSYLTFSLSCSSWKMVNKAAGRGLVQDESPPSENTTVLIIFFSLFVPLAQSRRSAAGTKRLLQITDLNFIHRGVPAAARTCLFTHQQEGQMKLSLFLYYASSPCLSGAGSVSISEEGNPDVLLNGSSRRVGAWNMSMITSG